jgi:hypothetical protein
VSRKAQGEALIRSFAIARAAMLEELAHVRQSIAADIGVVAAELIEARHELAEARREIQRLRALIGDAGPSLRVH